MNIFLYCKFSPRTPLGKCITSGRSGTKEYFRPSTHYTYALHPQFLMYPLL